jgi:hypothetical protein
MCIRPLIPPPAVSTVVATVPAAFEDSMSRAARDDPHALYVLWLLHTVEEGGGPEGLLVRFSHIVVDVLRSRPDMRRTTLRGCADRLPSPVAACLTRVLCDALTVGRDFLLPLLDGSEDYVHMYLRTLAARGLRMAGIGGEDADVDAAFVEVRGAVEMRDAMIDLRRETRPLHVADVERRVVFEPRRAARSAFTPVSSFEEAAAKLVTELPLKRLLGRRAVTLPDGRTSAVTVIAAGGFALSLATLLAHGTLSPCEDVDLYVLGAEDDATFVQAVADLVADLLDAGQGAVARAGKAHPVQAVTAALQTLTVLTLHDRFNMEHAQVSLRRFAGVHDVLLSYDLPAACFALVDFHTLVATEGAMHAVAHMTTTVDPWQHSRITRIKKYSAAKGFRVVVPAELGGSELLALRSLMPRLTRAQRLNMLRDGRWNVAQAVALQCPDFDERDLQHIDVGESGGMPEPVAAAGAAPVVNTIADLLRLGTAHTPQRRVHLYAEGKELVWMESKDQLRVYDEPREAVKALLSSERRTAARAKPYTRDMYGEGGAAAHFYCMPTTLSRQLMGHMVARLDEMRSDEAGEKTARGGGRAARFCERLWACGGRRS